MHLVEILLPIADNQGKLFDTRMLSLLRNELTEKFGGMTAFTRVSKASSIRTRLSSVPGS
jgi:hypothetical protein